MSIVKNLFKNTAWLGLAQIFNIITGIITSIFLARYLGDTNYGKYIFVVSFLNLSIFLIHYGFPAYFVNEISQNKNKLKIYLQNILSLKIIISLVYLFIIFIAINLSGKTDEIKNYIYIFALSIIFTSFLDLYFSVFRSYERMSHQTLFTFSISFFNLIFILLGIYLNYGLYFIFLVLLSSNFINFILASIFINKKYAPLKLKFDFKLWKELLIKASPFVLSAAFIKIYHDMDQVILSFMKGDQITGWYGADYKIMLVINMLGGVYFNSYHPVIARLYRENVKKFEMLIRATIKLIYIIIIPVALGITLLTDKIIQLFYGKEFLNGSLALKILIWTVIFTLSSQIYGKVLQASHNMKAYILSIGIGALINITANVLLIPRFSLEGAAFATLLALFSVFICMYIAFYKRIIKINILNYAIRPIIASVFMGILVYYLNFYNYNLFLSIFSGAFCYFLVIILIKGVKVQELKLLKTIIFAKDINLNGKSK